MNLQLSSIVLTIIFVITISSISSSYATPPCSLFSVEDTWMAYDDIYTGKVVSISNQTDYAKDDPSLSEWQKKADTRINFELEHFGKYFEKVDMFE